VHHSSRPDDDITRHCRLVVTFYRLVFFLFFLRAVVVVLHVHIHVEMSRTTFSLEGGIVVG